jgi:hypothetical protein
VHERGPLQRNQVGTGQKDDHEQDDPREASADLGYRAPGPWPVAAAGSSDGQRGGQCSRS